MIAIVHFVGLLWGLTVWCVVTIVSAALLNTGFLLWGLTGLILGAIIGWVKKAR